MQSLTNVLYLATEGDQGGSEGPPGSARSLAMEVSPQVERLSTLVNSLLALPYGSQFGS